MECGSQDLVCQIISLLEDSEVLASGLTDLIGRLGENASGVAGALAQFLRDYGQTVVGLLGFSFGFWRWWRYREHILHTRLEQYIAESDRRFETSHDDLLEAIQRPGPSQKFRAPLFSDADLTSVLRERRWDTSALALTVAGSADAQLNTAIDRINRRLEAANRAVASLRSQLASAHTLRGAIAASLNDTPTRAEFALKCFRKALRVSTARMSILAKELEAHQLRKLGHLDRAALAYNDLLDLTGNLDALQQAVVNARAKRYLAEITQAQKIIGFLEGDHVSPASRHARKLMSGNEGVPGALVVREHFEPYQGWDLLEGAEMCYFASFVCSLHPNNHVQAEQYLQDSMEAFQGVLDDLAKHDVSHRRSRKKLKGQAQLGLKRAVAARSGNYDIAWLLPSLTVEQTEQITARIRAARSK